jgi:hypothetical protein
MILFFQQAHLVEGLPLIVVTLISVFLFAWMYREFSATFRFFDSYSMRRKISTISAMAVAWAAEIYLIYYLFKIDGK